MAELMVPVPSEPAQHRPKSERRAAVRFLISEENGGPSVTASSPEHPEVGWFGQLLDISLGGVGLGLTRPFDTGTLLMLELWDPALGKPRSFPVCVVHARQDEEGGWLVGCEFIYPLREEELRAFVGD
jgi:hypothetical protein